MKVTIFISMSFLIDQRDTNGLANENTELKLRLQAMEQQAQLRNGKTKINTQKLILYRCILVYCVIFNLCFGFVECKISSKRSLEERS